MRRKPLLWSVFVVFAAVSMSLSACGQAPQAPAAGETPAAQEPVTLKIALLPIVDALPMYVAEKEGLFAARGVKMEFLPAGSAAQRDQVVMAGQVDGMINDMVSTLFYNKEQTQVQVVRFARTATATTSMYRIIAAKDSGITTAQDLKGVPIGISEGTVIAYMTDRLLQAEGLAPADIRTTAVPSIADRMTLLNKGELKAATLPDPFFSLALQQGGVLVVDDVQHPEFSYSLISFTKKSLDAHPEAVRAFLAAIEDATAKINADPEAYRSLLGEYKVIPDALLETYQMPPFTLKSVPSAEQYQDAMDWAKAKGLLAKDVPYEASVTADFLP